MPLGSAEDHKLFGSLADKTLKDNKLAIILACEALHGEFGDEVFKYSRKRGLRGKSGMSSPPFSILKIKMDEKTRYFALNNHKIDPQTKSQKIQTSDEGVGGASFFKPMRELLLTFSDDRITSVAWATMGEKNTCFGLKREKSKAERAHNMRNMDLFFVHKNEVKALQQVEGTNNVVSINYQGKASKKYAIVQPWFLGGELYRLAEYADEGRARRAKQAQTPTWSAEKVYMFFETCLAILVKLHQAGWVHRDIKPQNICLDVEGNPHLIDYGLSLEKINGQVMAEASGTLDFLAPEINPRVQKALLYSYTDKTDVYAMGGVIQNTCTKLLGSSSDNKTTRVQDILEELTGNMRTENIDNRWDAEQALHHLQINSPFLEKNHSTARRKTLLGMSELKGAFKIQLKRYLFSDEMRNSDLNLRKKKLAQLTKDKFSDEKNNENKNNPEHLLSFIMGLNEFYKDNQRVSGSAYNVMIKLLQIYLEMLAVSAHAHYKSSNDKVGMASLKRACGMTLVKQRERNVNRYGKQKSHLTHQHRNWFHFGIFGRSLTRTAKNLEELFDQVPTPKPHCVRGLSRCLFRGVTLLAFGI